MDMRAATPGVAMRRESEAGLLQRVKCFLEEPSGPLWRAREGGARQRRTSKPVKAGADAMIVGIVPLATHSCLHERMKALDWFPKRRPTCQLISENP